jgi:hypothetical protein
MRGGKDYLQDRMIFQADKESKNRTQKIHEEDRLQFSKRTMEEEVGGIRSQKGECKT